MSRLKSRCSIPTSQPCLDRSRAVHVLAVYYLWGIPGIPWRHISIQGSVGNPFRFHCGETRRIFTLKTPFFRDFSDPFWNRGYQIGCWGCPRTWYWIHLGEIGRDLSGRNRSSLCTGESNAYQCLYTHRPPSPPVGPLCPSDPCRGGVSCPF